MGGIKKKAKFYIRHISYLYQIFFKEPSLKSIDERQQQFNNFSKLFFILSTTTDGKEKINNLLIMVNFIQST